MSSPNLTVTSEGWDENDWEHVTEDNNIDNMNIVKLIIFESFSFLHYYQYWVGPLEQLTVLCYDQHEIVNVYRIVRIELHITDSME